MSNHTLLYLPQSFQVALVKRLTNSFVKNMEEDVENPTSNETLDETDGGKNGKKSLWKFVKKRILSKFKYLIPFFVLIVYSLIGAGMFIALERDPDILRRAEMQVSIETARNSTVSVLREIITGVVPNWENDSYIMEAILNYEKNISFKHSVETEWDFWNAVLYAGTIYTTIGYGNIACKTFGGRLVSIFYAIFGIPLALTTLNDLGKMLLRIIEITSNVLDNLVRCKFKWARKKRRRNRPTNVSVEDGVDQPSAEDQSPDGEKMSLNEWDARSRDPQDDQSEDEERSDPPVLGAVVVTISWLFVCSGIFCIWEDWDYFTSFYFFFVSLSTIGFGDVTPAFPAYMVMNFALVLIGLALVSVCIGVVQQKLQDMYMSLLMTLLKEYQKMLEAGENEMGASLGMAQMWTRNRKAKWLMPFLSKDKRNMVMQKFHEEAKAHNIELPAAFTSVDKKSGLPSIVKAVEKEKIEEWAIKEEQQRAPTLSVAPVEESQLQRQASAPAPRPESCHMTSQTSLNVYAETEQQTYSSSFQLREAMSQTALYELQNRHMQTASSLFQLREATSQTAIRESEARAMQTLASCLSLQQDTSSQTVVKQFHEQPMQTAYSYFQARENESQTLSPIAEHAQSQTNLSYFRSQVGSSQTHSTFTGVKETLSQTALSAFASRHGFAQTDASAFANRHDASQTDLSAFQLQHGYSQTDLLTLRNFDSQTDLSAFQRSDYGNQTDPTASGEAVSQTDVSMVKFYTDDVGSQTNVALLDDRQIQTEYGEQSFATSQTDLSAFGFIDSDSQTTSASVADSALQHGSSLADLTSVALQASYAQNDSMSQTLSSTFQLRAAQSQTTICETSDDSSQTQTNGPQLSWAQSQTELNVQDNTNQTAISFFKLRNVDSQTFYDASDQSLQTDRNETDESECQTFVDTNEESAQAGSEFFRFEQNESQTTLVTTDEIQIQTDSSYFDVAHFGSQTLKNYTDDTHSQTNSSAFDVADQCQQAYVKGDLRDAGVQTGILARVEHLVSRKQGKSKEAEEQSSASYFLTKRKSLKKINNKPAALTLSDDEGQARRKRDKSVSSGESDLNETGNKKDKLEWNPMDGRHVEKQKPVSALLKKFERRSSRQKLTEPSPPPPTSPLGAPKRRPRVDSQ